MFDLMQQFVYWQVPVWQLVLVATAVVLALSWLLISRFSATPALQLPLAFAVAQPLFYYEPDTGITGLNAAARQMLGRRKDDLSHAALRDMLAEALTEGRVLQQHNWPSASTTLLILPVLNEDGEIRGSLGMVTSRVADRGAAVGPDEEIDDEKVVETDAAWQPIGRYLQQHTIRARVRVKRQGRWQENELSHPEQQLLQFLLAHPNEPQTAETLFAAVWQNEEVTRYGLQPAQRDRLRRLVYQLRQLIEPAPGEPTYLITVHGVGYIFHSESAT